MEAPDRDAEAPLLEKNPREDDVGLHERPAAVEIFYEAKIHLELGVPVVLMGLLDFLVQVISVAFVGRLGAMNLAGASMAASFANVFGFAVLEGLAGGMETIGGQAYGNGQSHLLGYLLQRGQLVLMTFCLPICVLWGHASWVLRQWGQDVEIAALAGQYVMFELPGLFATALYLPVSKFLQMQRVTKPLAVISCAVLIVHAPICWLYIYALDLGFVGAALANSTSNVVTLILLVLFLNLEGSGILSRSWPGWSLAAFKNLGPFLALALPACAMTAFQWWVWEILQIMSGWLPHPDIAVSAITICFQTVGIFFMLPLGLGTAASAGHIYLLQSNALGAQRPGRARLAVIVSLTLTTIVGGFLAVTLLVVRKPWASVFIDTSETAVLQAVADLVPVVVACIMGVGWNAVLSAVLRGSGQQLAGSVVNTIALYGFSLPLAYIFGIKMEMGLQGLWWGMMVGVFLQLIGQAVLTGRTNWEYQAKRAIMTVNNNSHQIQTNLQK